MATHFTVPTDFKLLLFALFFVRFFLTKNILVIQLSVHVRSFCRTPSFLGVKQKACKIWQKSVWIRGVFSRKLFMCWKGRFVQFSRLNGRFALNWQDFLQDSALSRQDCVPRAWDIGASGGQFWEGKYCCKDFVCRKHNYVCGVYNLRLQNWIMT